jgi:hypothetical protein
MKLCPQKDFQKGFHSHFGCNALKLATPQMPAHMTMDEQV